MTSHAVPLGSGINASGSRRIWAWPLAIVVGFPLGGLVASLVAGPVDDVTAAVLGGAIAGAVIGAAQWLALRAAVSPLWIAATAVGMSSGLAAGAALVGYGTSNSQLALMGAVTGVGVGLLQALVLSRSIRGAAWWAVAAPPTWAIGWFVTAAAGIRVDEQFTNFGLSGVLVFALLTGLLLAALTRRPRGAAA